MGWVKRDMGLPALRWPAVAAIEQLQREGCWRPERKAGSEGEKTLGRKGASTTSDVDGVSCAIGKRALVMVVEVFTEEWDVFAACAGRSSEKKRMDSRLVSFPARGQYVAPVPRESKRVVLARRCKHRR